MKGLKKLRRYFSSQEYLYFLFVLLAVIPCVGLAVTDSTSLMIRIASVLVPLALWMGVMLISRKPGIMVWCLMLLFLLSGGQLVLLYLFGESVIAVDMFLNLTSSNASEASELIANIILVIGFVFIFYTLPTFYLAYRSVRLKDKLSDNFRKRWLKISSYMFCIGVAFSLFSLFEEKTLSIKNDIYPINALYNLCFAINKAHMSKNYRTTSESFTFQASKAKQVDNRREIYVLVIGETGRAMEWSLYGYERETTPCLEKEKGLIYFRDALTQSNNTHKSVPIILSAASAEDYDILYEQKSIVTAFKEAGFRTLVIANQKLTTSMIGEFYREADVFIDISTQKKNSYLTSLHDGAILPYVKEEISKSSDNLFIVLHTYGSHFNYHERYPKEFAKYTPDKAEGILATYKNELRNSYDNSIRYTDYVLGKIIELLDQTGDCSSLLYLSDHGEDIFDDSRNRYLHASPIPTYYQLHIPYFLWFSDSYQEIYPDKYCTASTHQSFPISSNSVFHTMLDMAGIETPVANPTLALTNKAFTVKSRMYMDDHDDPVPFWEIGLKKQDFAMLDKWKIAYEKE